MVSVDTVYQRVLAICNKEQRGYITPQEYNLFANQAQMSIFNQYIHDIKNVRSEMGNSFEYADPIDLLHEKIAPFAFTEDVTSISNGLTVLPLNDYLGTVQYVTASKTIEVTEIKKNDAIYINASPLAAPDSTRPVYVRENETQIQIYPTNLTTQPSEIRCSILRAPTKRNNTDAVWGYAVVGENALFNVNEARDFLLHASEETMLVIKILELAGISLKEPGLVQAASQEELQLLTQQKS
tara:strand:- start:221 stop:940 length:720 start_codon:yes stop_codon:yes gene_type:complete